MFRRVLLTPRLSSSSCRILMAKGLKTTATDQSTEAVASVSSDEEASELRPLYLDAQATTPMDPRVLDAMMPYSVSYYGNPHSRTHAYGWESEQAVEHARKQVAELIGADPKEVVFTSGATESNNISVKGVGRFYKRNKKHVITTQTEHKCVLDSCRALESEGFDVTYLPVMENGLIDLQQLEDAMRPDTSLVSIMTVNNEIGVKQPVKEIAISRKVVGRNVHATIPKGALCRKKKIFFHTDAAQAVGKIPLDVNELNIDLMSISGHKIYGPKGYIYIGHGMERAPFLKDHEICLVLDILGDPGAEARTAATVWNLSGVGALYIRRKPRVRVEPIQSGGGQERGMRSGTVPHVLAVGLGAACEVAKDELEYDHKRTIELSTRLVNGITSGLSHVVRNGDPVHSYPGCVNLSFAFVEGESLLMALKDVALSSGSACTSASLEPSYVLRAIGADDDLAHSSIRFGIGRFTTEEEIDYTVEKTIKHVKRLREMSPLWEMVQEGIDLKTIKWTQH